MARVFSALPARALHGRPPGARATFGWSLLGMAMFGVILAFMFALLPPDLLTDWQVRDGVRALRDGTVSDSDCTGEDLLTMCSLTAEAPVGTGTVRRRLHYMFLSGENEYAYTVRVVADPRHPEWLSTDLGQESFWNRMACLLLGGGVVAALTLGGGWGASRTYRRARAWRRSPSQAVALRLVARQAIRNGEIWTLRGEDGQTVRWPAPRRAAPFTLGTEGEVLGLQRLDGTAIMPLDRELRWVDLSPAERSSVLGPPQG